MKITVNRKAFTDALADVLPFIPAKPVMQILRNAKIKVKGNRMKIEANNAQDSISRYLDLESSESDIDFCVAAADFCKFVGALRSDSIELNIEGEGVTVRHSKGSAEFQTLPADEFPSFKMPDDALALTVSSDMLYDAVSTASGFVATQTIRPMMCAIYAYIKEGNFGYAASDTHKMIHGFKAGMPAETDVNWFIMPTAFRSIAKACKLYQGDVTVTISEGKAAYRIGDTVINTVQTKGRYPDFNRVIPKDWAIDLSVDRDELVDSLKRLMMFCDDTQCIKIAVSRMDMLLSVDNIIAAKRGSETVVHNGCGGEITIGVNGQYMLDVLSAFNPGEIKICLKEANRPIIVSQESKPDVTTIVMPMEIRS